MPRAAELNRKATTPAISSGVLAVSTCSWFAVPAVLVRACVALPPLAAGAAAGCGAVAALPHKQLR